MALERGTTTRLSLQRLSRKFSLRNKEYAKVDDLYDTRVPLHNEEAFQHGLRFKAKYIGSLEISRPTNKLDIITAMRRIRYEFKVKGIRKVRCYVDVSMQGVKLTKRKRRRRRKHYTEDQLFIMHHPIYRIFYVSHDSQDLKIFSYITREMPDNTFKCNVFKAYKKGMALHVVRSLGQAFDVCHKLNPRPQKGKAKEKKEEKAAEGEEKAAEEAAPAQPSEGPAKEVSTDLDAFQKLSLENGAAHATRPTSQMELTKDLMSFQFDPFSGIALGPNPNNAFMTTPVPNGTPITAFDPFQSSFVTSSSVPPPPLTMTNTSTNLPDLPEGMTAAQARAIPPPHAHLAFMSRPRPRPGSTSSQTVIQENPFTDLHGPRGSESPTLSIGEPLGTIHEGTRQHNPFRATEDVDMVPPTMWDLEKQQLVAQMTLLQEQLRTETSARIESQARVEHLLLQNKELLSHLQKLMVQLQQLQSLQMSQLTGSATSPDTTSPDIPQPVSTDAPVIVPSTSGTVDESLNETVENNPPAAEQTSSSPFPVTFEADEPPASTSPILNSPPAAEQTTSSPFPVTFEADEPPASTSPIINSPPAAEQTTSSQFPVTFEADEPPASTSPVNSPPATEQTTSSQFPVTFEADEPPASTSPIVNSPPAAEQTTSSQFPVTFGADEPPASISPANIDSGPIQTGDLTGVEEPQPITIPVPSS